jgi:hypothetical protein
MQNKIKFSMKNERKREAMRDGKKEEIKLFLFF